MLSDDLHDRIDMREELRDRAADAVKRVVKEKFGEALDVTTSLEDALTYIAALASTELDQLTSEAVQAGARHTMKRGSRG